MTTNIDLFAIWKQYFNPNEIKAFIDNSASRLIISFKELFNWIEVEPLLGKLWDVLTLKNIRVYDWELLFLRLIKEVLTPVILNKMGKVTDEILNISSKWFDYLIKRTVPHLSKLPDNFYTLLHMGSPVSDEQAYKAQEKRLARVYEGSNLMKIFDSGETDLYKIVEVFEQNFGNQYPQFLSRCTHLGDEWGKHEGKTYRNKLSVIFQLNDSNDRTPPDNVKDTLLELIHIRNAPSHKDTCGIIPVSDNEVRIRDRKADGTLTYDKTVPKEDLWKFFYKLIVLDRGLDVFAIYLDLYEKLRIHDKNSIVFIDCSCGIRFKIYFPPHASQILCRNCLKVHTRDKLTITGMIN